MNEKRENHRLSDSNPIPPVVLAASGLDPTGSAGLIADIRVIAALGCHPCGVITCETVQSSRGLTHIRPSEPGLLEEQLLALVEDLPIRAVKIGAVASVEVIEVLARILRKMPETPVVLDPVFAPTVGPAFLDLDGMRAMSMHLLPHTLIATPNAKELGTPAGLEVDPSNGEMILGCADGWFGTGVKSLLVTGLVLDGRMVDRFFRSSGGQEIITTDITHPRHDVGEVHGTGCVLSSAIAAFLAKGEQLASAVERAVEFTCSMIGSARKLGEGAAFGIERKGYGC